MNCNKLNAKLFAFGLLMNLISMILMFMGIDMFDFNTNLIYEWELFSVELLKFKILFFLDGVSLVFLSVVLLISSMVLIYSLVYMSEEKYKLRFYNLLFLFIISMCLMIIMPNALSILLGWDGLGVISYLLVIFYQSKSAYKSGMITILINRIGDIGLIMLICLCVSLGSLNLMLYSLNIYMVYMMVLAAMTKSAQLPFSIWLPAAMTAPTPISSLVHSSTLVTAGIYLLIRFKGLLNYEFDSMLLLISSLTMVTAGILANIEFDLKKIIAYSTLSQLGLMMSILSMGNMALAFFHLIVHALFKSLLFLCSGSFIHNMKGNQDVRFYGGFIYFYPLKSLIMIISLFSLCGVPFLSGFYSKDLILEAMNNSMIMNMFSLFLIYISTIFTISYSLRLMFWLLIYSEGVKMESYLNLHENKIMSTCFSIMLIWVVLYGFFFFFYIYDHYLFLNSLSDKLLILFLYLFGGFISYFYFCNMNNKFMKIMSFLKSSYYLDYIYLVIQKDSLVVWLFWFEYMLENMMINSINSVWSGMSIIWMWLYKYFDNKLKVTFMLTLNLFMSVFIYLYM